MFYIEQLSRTNMKTDLLGYRNFGFILESRNIKSVRPI